MCKPNDVDQWEDYLLFDDKLKCHIYGYSLLNINISIHTRKQEHMAQNSPYTNRSVWFTSTPSFPRAIQNYT